MINYDKLMVVAYDFDDTLFAHFNHKTETEDEEVNYMAACLNANVNNYKNVKNIFGIGSVNKNLKDFMVKCESDFIIQGLMSGTCAFLCADAKIKFVEEQYGINLRNWCVCAQEKKIQMLKALSLVHNCKYDNVLIIDDNYKVVTMAADAGFQSATPIEIVNFTQHLEK